MTQPFGQASADEDFIIQVRGLNNSFSGHVVHENLSLDVRRGEIIGIVGGSGTGKSVLLRSIVGLQKPQSGDLTVFGQRLKDLSEVERQAAEQRWGILFQDGALFSALSVAENVQVAFREHLSMKPSLMDELTGLKIRMVGLDDGACSKYPSELSGGMRKRAGLARALALDPEIVFLDEPTAGLDPIGAHGFDMLIKDLQEALGLTVFMVTHDLDTLSTVCDRIAVLADKQVILVGTMDDMLQSTHPWVREYFHGPRARAARSTG